MDFSRKLGRHVERFKQSAADAAADGPEYQCRECGAGFVTDYEECPDCDAEAVEAVAEADEATDGESEAAESRDSDDADVAE